MLSVDKIEKALGSRKRYMTEDQYQTFWVGVLKATSDLNPEKDQIPFLIMRGLGEIKNMQRSEYSYKYYKFCPVCGKEYPFRSKICICGQELEISHRHVELFDPPQIQEDPLDKIVIEEFLDTREEGTQKYVAKRWLQDRADVMYDNHLKQIGFELGISAPAVASHKKKIKQKFLLWYHK